MEFIDTHCHLEYDYSPKSTADLISEAHSKGVQTLVTIGTEMKTMDQIIAISEAHQNVFHTVGVHPHEAITIKDGDIEKLEEYCSHKKCKAVGEIGLDYHYDHSPRDVQIEKLNQQLDLAIKVNLPVVIHARQAEEDLIQALTRYAQNTQLSSPIGIIHCFSGTKSFGEKCIDLGFMISFSGIITFKKADDLRECVQAYPINKILIETDSPYLAPVPFRGKKCEPSMVIHTAEKIAELKGLTVEEVSKQTTLNAKKLFRI